MKVFTSIFLLAFVAFASGKPQIPKNSVRVSPFPWTPRDCQEGCSKDCGSLILCSGDVQLEVNCRDQTGGQRPFCNKDLKQCDVSPDNCEVEQTGECDLRDGVYPNIDNCKGFFYCDGKKRTDYMCLSNTIFNVISGSCEVGIQCTDFNPTTGYCKGKPKQLVAHPLKKSLYVYCAPPPAKSTLLQCNTDELEFDPLLSTCQFICKAVGNYPDENYDTTDKNKNVNYYECIKNGTGFIKNRRRCSKGMHFEPADQGKGRCKPNA